MTCPSWVEHRRGKESLIILDARIRDPKETEKQEDQTEEESWKWRFSDKVSPFLVDIIIHGGDGNRRRAPCQDETPEASSASVRFCVV